jgi:hypothetical protein
MFNTNQEYPFIIFDDDNNISYSLVNNETKFSYNKKASMCINNTECNPEHCYSSSNMCVAKKCDNSVPTCIETKIDYPLEVKMYDDIYVDSKYDGSKWKLHKVIPFHIGNKSSTEKGLNHIVIFKPMSSNQPNVVCFPIGEIIGFKEDLIYSYIYKITEKITDNTVHRFNLSIHTELNIKDILREIIDNPNEKYLFCGHSMGCVIAQFMLKFDWGELEQFKQNCSVVGSGGYNIFSQSIINDLHMNNRISLYVYGDKVNDELLVDKYLFNKKVIKESIDIPLYLLNNNSITPVLTKNLKPCYDDDENPFRTKRFHSWETYRREFDIIIRKIALKNKTRKNYRHRTINRELSSPKRSHASSRRSRRNRNRRNRNRSSFTY